MATILISQRNPLIADWFINYFQDSKCFNVAGSCRSNSDLMEKVDDAIDVVIVDIFLPGMSGITAIKKLRKQSPKLKFVAIADVMNVFILHELLELDVKAIVLKSENNARLVEATQAAMRDDSCLPVSVMPYIQEKISDKHPLKQLTDHELDYVLTRANYNLSDAKIADLCHVGVATIYTHRHHAFKKLEVKNEAQLQKLLRKYGFES